MRCFKTPQHVRKSSSVPQCGNWRASSAMGVRPMWASKAAAGSTADGRGDASKPASGEGAASGGMGETQEFSSDCSGCRESCRVDAEGQRARSPGTCAWSGLSSRRPAEAGRCRAADAGRPLGSAAPAARILLAASEVPRGVARPSMLGRGVAMDMAPWPPRSFAAAERAACCKLGFNADSSLLKVCASRCNERTAITWVADRFKSASLSSAALRTSAKSFCDRTRTMATCLSTASAKARAAHAAERLLFEERTRKSMGSKAKRGCTHNVCRKSASIVSRMAGML
mmetsp:Transcript_27829/g.83867  ORF Transcript_27829/g.83867 Transcript_27829/m.83867 type:complete len:285 (+) Transcript_27829:1025-1879(+)